MASLIKGWNLSASQLLAVLLVSLLSSLYCIFIYHSSNFNFFLFSTPNMEVAKTHTEPRMATETMEIFGVKIERNPNVSKLADLGVTSWKKWGCSPSKFPWTFKTKETMYLLEGKVKVYCDGYDGSFEIGAGDLVEFPRGMKVTWDVIEAVNKHYSLDDN